MSLDSSSPILVTGAAGRLGGVGRTVVELLRRRNLPVRALVHRDDERADHRLTHDVEPILGRPATSVRDYVARHAELFGEVSQP